MQPWNVTAHPFKTRTYEDAKKQTLDYLKVLQGKSKRKFAVKSRYFEKQKVFFDFFWEHLLQKPIAQRKARLQIKFQNLCGVFTEDRL